MESDASTRALVIAYTTPGRPTVFIGTQMPMGDETLDAIAKRAAPERLWTEQDSAIVPVANGETGYVTYPVKVITLETAKADKRTELAAWRYQREVDGVLLNGTRIATDRETQAQLTSAFVSLSQGFTPAVDWKGIGGTWTSLDLPTVTAIAMAVSQHVQQSFTLEKDIAAQIDAALTIEGVNAVVIEEVFGL